MKTKSIEYASAKCQCETCPIGCCLEQREEMDGTCDKFNRYVRMYREIAEPYVRRIAELESDNLSLRDTIDLMCCE